MISMDIRNTVRQCSDILAGHNLEGSVFWIAAKVAFERSADDVSVLEATAVPSRMGELTEGLMVLSTSLRTLHERFDCYRDEGVVMEPEGLQAVLALLITLADDARDLAFPSDALPDEKVGPTVLTDMSNVMVVDFAHRNAGSKSPGDAA